MALFAGLDILGLVLQMTTGDHPRDIQQNSFPGLNGIEALDGGSRGLTTQISGILSGDGLSGLAFVRENLRSFKNGQAYVLTDTTGVNWPNVLLERFAPSERIITHSDGTCIQAYSCEFLHLSG